MVFYDTLQPKMRANSTHRLPMKLMTLPFCKY